MTRISLRLARLTALSVLVAASAVSAQEIPYRHNLTAFERRCLAQLLEKGEWRYVPQTHEKMLSVAVVATVRLGGPARSHYIYVMDDFAFCGTVGCSMLIGEADKRGICREIYDGSGSETAITVLRERDYGYRRFYTPCEVRFDGHEYEQVREECPTINVQR